MSGLEQEIRILVQILVEKSLVVGKSYLKCPYLKDLLIGEKVAAIVTGTVLGFTIAYGLRKFCHLARNFFLNVNDNPGYVNKE